MTTATPNRDNEDDDPTAGRNRGLYPEPGAPGGYGGLEGSGAGGGLGAPEGVGAPGGLGAPEGRGAFGAPAAPGPGTDRGAPAGPGAPVEPSAVGGPDGSGASVGSGAPGAPGGPGRTEPPGAPRTTSVRRTPVIGAETTGSIPVHRLFREGSADLSAPAGDLDSGPDTQPMPDLPPRHGAAGRASARGFGVSDAAEGSTPRDA
ncbi:MAG TPA: hypothetical protein VIU94_08660, partial [Streptomyces sp.]